MALPTQANILTMDYPSRGLPFVDVPATSAIDILTMDYPSRGLPFVVNPYGTAASSIKHYLTTLGVGS